MTKSNQRGFSLVEGLLIFIAVALIAFVGYYIWHSNQTTNKVVSASATTKSNATAKTIEVDPTAKWTVGSSNEGQFSIKYPSMWVQPSCKADFPRAIYLGPDASSVLHCASEFFGQMSVTSTAGAKSDDAFDFSSGYVDFVKKSITVDGVAGQVITATTYGQTGGNGSLVDGSKVVEYQFTTNGNTYTARYVQLPSETDVLSEFTTMVTKTLKFE
jgi:hypothetical protein